MISYLSIYGPKGMAEPTRLKLETAFKNGMKDRTFSDTLRQFQVEESYLSGKEYSAKWRSQYEDMGKILDALGLVEK